METRVLLLSESAAFESTWRPLLEAHELTVRRGESIEWASLMLGYDAVVIDAAATAFVADEDEILTALALARASQITVAVQFGTKAPQWNAALPVIEDLCGNLLARDEQATPVVSAALGRRFDKSRERRLELLTLSPVGEELLCLLADGTSILVPRPYGINDDGSDVVAIEIAASADRARLTLATGTVVELHGAQLRAQNLQTTLLEDRVAVTEPSLLVKLDSVQLGGRLRALRLEVGLTQAELSRRTGIHRPNIARVEAGRHTPSLETLERLASAMGISTARMLQRN